MKKLALYGIEELHNRNEWMRLCIEGIIYQEYTVAEEMYEISVHSTDEEILKILEKISLAEESLDGIVITVMHEFYDTFVKLLQSIKWRKEVYIVPDYLIEQPAESIVGNEVLVPIDISKPCLRYFEFHLCDHCNLNCRGCAHLSNVCREEFADKEAYFRDLKQIKKLYWGMQAIKLLGGEPLLNPEISDYVYGTRAEFPEAFLYIATNGLLIPRMSEDFFEAVRKTYTVVMLSAYPPTMKMKDEIEQKLLMENISFFYTPEVNQFQKLRYSTSKCIDRVTAHKRCREAMPEPCVTLRDGKLYQCGIPYLEMMNEKFGTNYKIEEGDVADLYKETSGWDANKKLYEPIPFCEYCGICPETFQWEPLGGKKAALEDYLNCDVV